MAAHPSPSGNIPPVPPRPGSRLNPAVLCAVVLLILTVNLFGGEESSDASGPPHARHAPQAGHPSGADSPADPEGKHLPPSRPVRLLIPEISVSAPFTPLRIGRNGQLDPPPADDVNLVGWYADGTSPGAAGTSIIAGHVDTATSPAVFAGLGELDKGDVFHVVRADQRKATFMVDSVETFKKANFPDKRVYADTPRALVRLITCAGAYDRKAKDYTENLVVFGHLV